MVLDFAFLPPEINSALMYAGAGSGPLLAAAAAWDGLAADMWASASSFDSVVSGLASNGQWMGPSAESMTQAAGPYLQWLHGAAAHASMSAMQARVAAMSYEGAFAATVPPAGDSSKSCSADDIDRDEHSGPEHRSNCGHRIRIRRDVASGCDGHVRVSRGGAIGDVGVAVDQLGTVEFGGIADDAAEQCSLPGHCRRWAVKYSARASRQR